MSFWQKLSKDASKECHQSSFPVWSLGVTVGVIFLLLGFFNEQFVDIYRKAIMICLECIGIG